MKKFLLLMVLAVVGHAQAQDTSESRSVTYLGKVPRGDNAPVIDVTCTKGQGFCTLNGTQVARRDMVGVVPTAKWGYCRMEFCYNTAGMKQVIGLNPEYFIYALRQRPQSTGAIAVTPTDTNVE